MSKYMLNDEDAINDVNPFVTHDFSLPGGVRQTGGFDDFTEIKQEPGIVPKQRSVYCDYGLCAESTGECSLSRPIHPRRNIDRGYTQNDRTFVQRAVIGVAKNPKFSMIGALICIATIAVILYYLTR
jgi:hypothetical protein